jgi:hypothetical protein
VIAEAASSRGSKRVRLTGVGPRTTSFHSDLRRGVLDAGRRFERGSCRALAAAGAPRVLGHAALLLIVVVSGGGATRDDYRRERVLSRLVLQRRRGGLSVPEWIVAFALAAIGPDQTRGRVARTESSSCSERPAAAGVPAVAVPHREGQSRR